MRFGVPAIVLAGCTILLFQYAQQFPRELELERSMRITIPTIHVDAEVEQVGLANDGEMDVPKLPTNAAWFELGPRPGEKGNAVIAGHFGWKNGTPAVFDNLHTLRKGDKVYVENEHGALITFVIRERRIYNANADASEVFVSSDGKAHLNLITCEGVWNNSKKSYVHRLVVFADQET